MSGLLERMLADRRRVDRERAEYNSRFGIGEQQFIRSGSRLAGRTYQGFFPTAAGFDRERRPDFPSQAAESAPHLQGFQAGGPLPESVRLSRMGMPFSRHEPSMRQDAIQEGFIGEWEGALPRGPDGRFSERPRVAEFGNAWDIREAGLGTTVLFILFSI